MIFEAPRYLATWMACFPAIPVAPLISTASPVWNFALPRSEPQVARPGFPSAAATASSIPGDSGMVMARETTAYSAMEPKGARGAIK